MSDAATGAAARATAGSALGPIGTIAGGVLGAFGGIGGGATASPAGPLITDQQISFSGVKKASLEPSTAILIGVGIVSAVAVYAISKR